MSETTRGSPDYRPTVFLRRGETYSEFIARDDETLKIFLLSYKDTSKLAAAGSAHLVDFGTGLPMPYSTPVGYYLDMREWMFTFNGLVRMVLAFDAYTDLYFYPLPNHTTHEYEQIVFANSRYWDPDAEDPHTIDCVIENVSADAVVGLVQIACVVKKVGSGGSKTSKKVRCRGCGHDYEIPIKESKAVCPKCGVKNLYPLFGLIGDVWV